MARDKQRTVSRSSACALGGLRSKRPQPMPANAGGTAPGREGTDSRKRSPGPLECARDRTGALVDGDTEVRRLLASASIATVADPNAFKSGRCLSAWIGLVPKQISSGGKARLGSISKAGNRYMRHLLVVGSMAVIRYAKRNGTRRPWLVQLMARRTTEVAAVALANKTARMVGH